MSGYRARFSPTTGTTSTGMPANELWGVAQRDRSQPRRSRSARARARRNAKRVAKWRNMPLKAYLRNEARLRVVP